MLRGGDGAVVTLWAVRLEVHFELRKKEGCFFIFIIEELRQWTHELGHMSHKGIAQGAVPASGVWNVDENKGVVVADFIFHI